jgi:hypothetical protein
MLSERTQWIILFLVFFAISLVIGFWIIPYRLLEYNLAINLLTSSIFTAITVGLISWFVNLADTIRWKKVENEVHWDIEFALSEIFQGILSSVENGYAIKLSAMTLQNKEDRKKSYLIQLRNLKDAKEIKLDQMYLKLFLEHESALEPFSSVSKRLGETQIKYSRFLSPGLTISLMNIQRSIFALETTSQMVASFKRMAASFNRLPKELTVKISQMSEEKLEAVIQQSISTTFKKMIEEIYKMSQMGYEISLVD